MVPRLVADATARAVSAMRADGERVVVDSPEGVAGADVLATLIVDELRAARVTSVSVVDDRRLLDALTHPRDVKPAAAAVPSSRRGFLVAVPVAVVVLVVSATAVTARRHDAAMPMTTLVEGRLAVDIPADWTVERLTRGPGSARIQLVSPSDPQTAVHVTQSPIPSGQTLQLIAETLKRAIDGQPPGVFVDLNPADQLASRPVVTYREVRAGHDIRWAVMIDDPIRIAIGCQSAPGREEAVRHACEQAVASARALSRSAANIAGTESAPPQSKP
jgi:type VII secretion-associated protein (TIGR03931 family)